MYVYYNKVVSLPSVNFNVTRKDITNEHLKDILKKTSEELFGKGLKNAHERVLENILTNESLQLHKRLIATLKLQYIVSPFTTIMKLKTKMQELIHNFDFNKTYNRLQSFRELVKDETNETYINKYAIENKIIGVFKVIERQPETIDSIIQDILLPKFQNILKTIPAFKGGVDFPKLRNFIEIGAFETNDQFNIAPEILKALNYDEQNVNSYFSTTLQDFKSNITHFINSEFEKKDNNFIKKMYELLVEQAKSELDVVVKLNKDLVGNLDFVETNIANAKSKVVEHFFPSYTQIITKYGLNDSSKIEINGSITKTKPTDIVGTLNLEVKYKYDANNKWDLISKIIMKLEKVIPPIDKALQRINTAFAEATPFPHVITEKDFDGAKIPQKNQSKYYDFLYGLQSGELEITLDEFNNLFKKQIQIDLSNISSTKTFKEIIKIKLTKLDHKIMYKLGVKQINLDGTIEIKENDIQNDDWVNTQTSLITYASMIIDVLKKFKFHKNNWLDEFIDDNTQLYTQIYNGHFLTTKTNFISLHTQLVQHPIIPVDTFLKSYRIIQKLSTTINNDTQLRLLLVHNIPNVDSTVQLSSPKEWEFIWTLKNSDMFAASKIVAGNLKRESDIKSAMKENLNSLKPALPNIQPKPQIGDIVPDSYYVIFNDKLHNLKYVSNLIKTNINVDVAWSSWQTNSNLEEGLTFTITTLPKPLYKVSDGKPFSIVHSTFVPLEYKFATQKNKDDLTKEITNKLKGSKNIDEKDKAQILKDLKTAINKPFITREELDQIKNKILRKIEDLNNNVELIHKLHKFYKKTPPKSVLDLVKKYAQIINDIIDNKELTIEERKKLLLSSAKLFEILSRLKKINPKLFQNTLKSLSQIRQTTKYPYFAIGTGLGVVGLTGIASGSAMIVSAKRTKKINFHIQSKKVIIFTTIIASIVAIASSIGTLLTFFIVKGGM